MIAGAIVCVGTVIGASVAGNLLDERLIELPDGLLPFAVAGAGGLVLAVAGAVALVAGSRTRG